MIDKAKKQEIKDALIKCIKDSLESNISDEEYCIIYYPNQDKIDIVVYIGDIQTHDDAVVLRSIGSPILDWRDMLHKTAKLEIKKIITDWNTEIEYPKNIIDNVKSIYQEMLKENEDLNLRTLTKYEAEDILIKSGAANIIKEIYVKQEMNLVMKYHFKYFLEDTIRSYELNKEKFKKEEKVIKS